MRRVLSCLFVVVLVATGCSATATTSAVDAAQAVPVPTPVSITPVAPTESITPESATPESATPESATPESATPESATPGPATPDPVIQETPTSETPTAAPEPAGPVDPPALGADLEWVSCPGGECTTVAVPLDYDEPDGASIDVAVIRAPALDPDGRIGSIFVNFGGPGGESTSIFRWAAPVMREQFRQFDIVSWDPRGIGETERLACDGDLDDEFAIVELDPSDGLDDEVAEQADEFAEVVACALESGPIIDHLGTVNVARDMEQVRLALGDEPMNYLGLSYGTQVGWVYATLFGESVRAMILDGAVPAGSISADDFTDQLAAFERTFEYFDQVCGREPTCVLADEGLAETVERVAAQLRRNPVELLNDQVFGEAEFRQAVLFAMYQPPAVIGPQLTAWINNAANGNVQGMQALRQGGASDSTPGGYQAVLCADGGAFPSAEGQVADFEATFDASATFGMLGETVRCDLWPGEVELPPTLDSSAAPTIVVVGNTFDPATPFEDAVLLDQQLADSVLVTVEGGGHTAVLDNGCAGSIAIDYFADLITPPPGTVCAIPGLFGVELVTDESGGGSTSVRINTVLPGSAALAAGIQVNDIVVSIDEQPMMVTGDIPVIAAGTPSQWVISRDDDQITLTVTPAARPWT